MNYCCIGRATDRQLMLLIMLIGLAIVAFATIVRVCYQLHQADLLGEYLGQQIINGLMTGKEATEMIHQRFPVSRR